MTDQKPKGQKILQMKKTKDNGEEGKRNMYTQMRK